jgi:signal transduction histidine kinase
MAASGAHAAVSPISQEELAHVVSSFNDLVARLQGTHESLRAEVSRLQGELREANRRLRRSQELAALGEMAAGIAHEIRNPLGSIRLYAGVLEEDLADRPELQETACKIARAVAGLDRIVLDVLDFAREARLRPEPVDACELLRHAADSCRASIESAGAELTLEGESGPALVFHADSSMLHRALVNVVRNAAEAVEGQALRRIVLSAAPARLRSGGGEAREAVALRVQDTGPGVPDDVQQRMFNPFFTTRAAGAGLGLAIVHRIVDAHTGSVEVRNAPEGGAVIELILPVDLAGPVTEQGSRA